MTQQILQHETRMAGVAKETLGFSALRVGNVCVSSLPTNTPEEPKNAERLFSVAAEDLP